MEEIYYSNIEYLDFRYFPVRLEDYEGTLDRPSCEKQINDTYYETQVGSKLACSFLVNRLPLREQACSTDSYHLVMFTPLPSP